MPGNSALTRWPAAPSRMPTQVLVVTTVPLATLLPNRVA